MRKLIHLQQTGDTIVEVLIVLAIVGLALSVSYATANRSLAGVQQAQEHNEALQLAATQLESLRVYAQQQGSSFTWTSGDCLSAGAVYPPSDAHCQNINSRYNLSINSASAVYKVLVQWPDVTGDGQDQVSLSYKVYVAP